MAAPALPVNSAKTCNAELNKNDFALVRAGELCDLDEGGCQVLSGGLMRLVLMDSRMACASGFCGFRAIERSIADDASNGLPVFISSAACRLQARALFGSI